MYQILNNIKKKKERNVLQSKEIRNRTSRRSTQTERKKGKKGNDSWNIIVKPLRIHNKESVLETAREKK
jgi:3-deoxy-D-arabino-heptulosonate 7-phosphate (DAHP) synthase